MFEIQYSLVALFLLLHPMQAIKGTPHTVGTGTVIIKLNNIQAAKGVIRLALYDAEEKFMIPQSAHSLSNYPVSRTGTMSIQLENIAYGEYAIAVFHDENSNEELETNFFGIPVEPYCFSGSGHSKWRPPLYRDAKFAVNQKEVTIDLELAKWKL